MFGKKKALHIQTVDRLPETPDEESARFEADNFAKMTVAVNDVMAAATVLVVAWKAADALSKIAIHTAATKIR
jgi:hypothetical protein